MSEDEEPSKISYRIAGMERKEPGKSDPPPNKRAMVELVTSILVCGAVGALIDRALETFPWAFLIMLCLGFAIGIRSVRQARKKAK